MFHYWKDLDRTQLYGAEDEGPYRDQVAMRECPDFALLRDVAEAYKHVTLTRRQRGRLVTHYDQTAAEVPLWDEAQWDEAPWDGQLVVMLDDGTKRPLADIMANVMAMWERMLDRMKL